ncbi:UNVERIFIED_CONTAM: hypothetical protein H355_006185 [Colinus virginianus]|nr:hypothetical protein H355_006185 [Colinus virginianus]
MKMRKSSATRREGHAAAVRANIVRRLLGMSRTQPHCRLLRHGVPLLPPKRDHTLQNQQPRLPQEKQHLPQEKQQDPQEQLPQRQQQEVLGALLRRVHVKHDLLPQYQPLSRRRCVLWRHPVTHQASGKLYQERRVARAILPTQQQLERIDAISRKEEADILEWADDTGCEARRNAAATTPEATQAAADEAEAATATIPGTLPAAATSVARGSKKQMVEDSVAEKEEKNGRRVRLLEEFRPVELCLLDYSPDRGSHIDEHIDDAWFWGPRLLTFSLAGATFLSFISPTMCLPLSIFIPLLRRTEAARKKSRSCSGTPHDTHRNNNQQWTRSTNRPEEDNTSGCKENGLEDQQKESRSSGSELAAEDLVSSSNEILSDTASGETSRRIYRAELAAENRRGGSDNLYQTETQDGQPCGATYNGSGKDTQADDLGRSYGNIVKSMQRKNCVVRGHGKECIRAVTEESGATRGQTEGGGGALASEREGTAAEKGSAASVGASTEATGAAATLAATAGGDTAADTAARAEGQGWRSVWGGVSKAAAIEGSDEQLVNEAIGGGRDEEDNRQVFVRVRVEIRVPLPARSMVVVTGAARYKWAHAVRAHHVCERRVALTLRELSAVFLQGRSVLHSCFV